MEEENKDLNTNEENMPVEEVVSETVVSEAPAEDKKFTASRSSGNGQAEKVKAYKSDRKGPAHVIKRRGRVSEYGAQLKEKQEVKKAYGVAEKQFANYVKRAQESLNKEIAPALKIYLSLESRLDNVVYRMGLAKTRPFARQMVSHGHIFVNGKRINVPSHTVRIGDIIAVREGSKATKLFNDIKERTKNAFAPDWLKFDINKLEAKVEGQPKTIEGGYDFAKIIELYSK